MQDIPIGIAARRSGVKVPTIRYYEDIGLLPPPKRVNGRRFYDEDSVRRLTFVRHARTMDFPIVDIRTLLSLQDYPNKSCVDADAIARARLADVEHRIANLAALRKDLRTMIYECVCKQVAKCSVIGELSSRKHQEEPHLPVDV